MNEPVPGDALYRNPAAPVAERIADLLGRMTLEEKVGQMMQLDARSADLEELIVGRHVGSVLHTDPGDLPRAAEIVRERTRLGIPLVIGDDCIHGYSFWPGATIYPSQLGMAVGWDPAMVEAAARATAEEVSATGVHWTFSPVLCIARDTRWGRVDETFGEDPVLIGELASAMVRGYQGGAKAEEPLPKDAILACAKHFAGYSETQGGRDASEADLSHRKLESWFLPPFERVAREGCGTFMLGYESIEGVPVTFNKWLLDDRLRGAWGYRGMLVTDWDNVGRAVWEQHVKPDYVHAAADAVRAGNDLVMTTPGFYGGALEAVRAGLLDESLVDAAVERILALKFRLGLFEDPRLPDARRIGAVVGSDAHREVNLAMARESVALLRNDGALPFALPQVAGDAAPGVAGDVAAPGASAGGAGAAAPGVARGLDAAAGASGCVRAPRRIAVVGPLADDAQAQLGDWAGCSGQVGWMPDGQPRDMIVTVLDGVRDIAGRAGVEVTYARGADLVDLVPDPAGDTYPDGQPRPKVAVPAPADRALIDGAVAAARGADLVVAVVGDVVQLVGEGRSTATLELVGGQNALLEADRQAVGRGADEFEAVGAARLRGRSGADRRGRAAGRHGPALPGRRGRRGGRHPVGAEPRHAGRAGHRRDPVRVVRAHGPPADHLPEACGPAAGLLQPDPRPARRPVRRPDAGPGVRVRRGPVVHGVRIRRAGRDQRAVRRGVRQGRRRACRGPVGQCRREGRHRGRATLRRRPRDLVQLDRPRAQGLPTRDARAGRAHGRRLRPARGRLHDRRR